MSYTLVPRSWLGLLAVCLLAYAGCAGESSQPEFASAPDASTAPSIDEEFAIEEPAAESNVDQAIARSWNEHPPTDQIAAEAAVEPIRRSALKSSAPSFITGPQKRMASAEPAMRKTTEQPELAAMESAEPQVAAMESAEPKLETEASEVEFKTVDVFYATDRQLLEPQQESVVLPTKPGLAFVILLILIAIGALVFNQLKISLMVGGGAAVLFAVIATGHDNSPNRIGVRYGGVRGELVRGISTVTIPNIHQRGIVERPSIFRLEFEEDQSKHVVLSKAYQMNEDEFYHRLTKQVAESVEPDLMVFVHGFNVDFDSAVRRTAQLSTDLGLGGVPVCYSWPSQGKLTGYTIDENNVIWTEPHLRKFLIELADKSHASSINIIAHSMGNRAVTAALSRLSVELPEDQLPMFDRIVLAAPDVDADHFRRELAPQLAQIGQHVTLYASSDDKALVASKQIHGGYPRAGESGSNLVVVPYLETIDVSGIDLSLLGHSYYGSSESILRDLYDVVRNRLPASQRAGLISRTLENTPYWKLHHPEVSELETNPTR